MATKEAESTAFKLSLQQSLLDPIIVEQYQVIFKPMLTPIMDALQRSNALVDTLRKQLEAKNQEVADLCSEVVSLKVMTWSSMGIVAPCESLVFPSTPQAL